MAIIPNPNNGYIPKIGETCTIIGACHPRSLGKTIEITQVYQVEGKWWFECKFKDNLLGRKVYSGGECGGLEPTPNLEIDKLGD